MHEFVDLFRKMLPVYDCQRSFDHVSRKKNYIVPALWLCHEDKMESYVSILFSHADEYVKRLLGSAEFRSVLDGYLAETYYNSSIEIGKSLGDTSSAAKR
jgi:hypothetical protein